MKDLVFIRDYGRHKAGDTFKNATSSDIRLLVEVERVAVSEEQYRAEKELEGLNLYSEASQKRVVTTTVTQSDVKNMQRLHGAAPRATIPFEGGEFPTFNTCTHTLVDLHAERVQDLTKTNNMHTVSIRLPNGDYLTVAVIPYNDDTAGSGCIDIQYHGDKETKIIAFREGGGAAHIKDFTFHTLAYEGKDTEQVNAIVDN